MVWGLYAGLPSERSEVNTLTKTENWIEISVPCAPLLSIWDHMSVDTRATHIFRSIYICFVILIAEFVLMTNMVCLWETKLWQLAGYKFAYKIMLCILWAIREKCRFLRRYACNRKGVQPLYSCGWHQGSKIELKFAVTFYNMTLLLSGSWYTAATGQCFNGSLLHCGLVVLGRVFTLLRWHLRKSKRSF